MIFSMHTTYFLQGCRCGDKIKPTEAGSNDICIINHIHKEEEVLVNLIIQKLKSKDLVCLSFSGER